MTPIGHAYSNLLQKDQSQGEVRKSAEEHSQIHPRNNQKRHLPA